MPFIAAAGMTLAFAVAPAAVNEFHRSGEVDLPKAVQLRDAPSIPADVPVAWRGKVGAASVTVRAAVQTKPVEDMTAFVPRIWLAIARNGRTRRYAIERNRIIPDCPGHRDEQINIEVMPFGSAGEVAGLIASYHEKGCGMHGSSDTDHMLLIDLHRARPRATEVGFSEIEMWGYANGGVFRRDESTTCRWRGDDFDCVDKLTTEAPWRPIDSVRHFHPLADKPLRPANVAYIDALVKGREVIVYGIGRVHPVMRFPSGVVLFAAAEDEDRLTTTFYLASSRAVKVAAANDLIQDNRHHEKESPTYRFTPIRDGVAFRASVLRRRGDERLVRVVEEVGKERSLFWVAVDPDDLLVAALRVAGTAAEGEWRGRTVPPSLLRCHFIDAEHASVVIVNRWVDDVFDGVRCRGDSGNDTGAGMSDAAVSWSSEGFNVKVGGDRDGPDMKVTIAANGALGSEPRTCGKPPP